MDPVLGDNGLLYPIFNKKTCEKMKELVRHSDLITPNITEACLLLNKKYNDDFSEKEVKMCIRDSLYIIHEYKIIKIYY